MSEARLSRPAVVPDLIPLLLLRRVGTIAGCLVGTAVWYASTGNAFAIVALVQVAELGSAWGIIRSGIPSSGVVYGVSYSVIVFIPYVRATDEAVVNLAWTRGYQISLGIIAAVLVGVFIWPFNVRSEINSDFADATMELQTLYLSLSRQMMQAGLTPSPDSAREFESLEQHLRSRLQRSRDLVALLDKEISIVPKPNHYFPPILTHLQCISEHLACLRNVREHGIATVRREAVLNILPLRKDFVSSFFFLLRKLFQPMLISPAS